MLQTHTFLLFSKTEVANIAKLTNAAALTKPTPYCPAEFNTKHYKISHTYHREHRKLVAAEEGVSTWQKNTHQSLSARNLGKNKHILQKTVHAAQAHYGQKETTKHVQKTQRTPEQYDRMWIVVWWCGTILVTVIKRNGQEH